MINRLPAQQMSATLSRALAGHQLTPDDSAVIFQDLSFLEERVRHLVSLFPESSLHAIAAKANPLPAVLEILLPLGAGVEAATIGEVYTALKSGYEPAKIVFDSPAKTLDELAFALKNGIHINADSFNELERIEQLRGQITSASHIGLRVNPQIGAGSISATSVAGAYSKFGVPINEFENEIIDFYKNHHWLNGIHMHVGSQGCSLGQLLEAAAKLTSLVGKLSDPIHWIDIGGGLPVEYDKNQPAVSMQNYVSELKAHCPELFSGKYSLITEFGRYIHVNTGWTASRVEYVKTYSGVNTAMIHVGADQFLRRCYQPEFWHHDISVTDPSGRLKPMEETKEYTIAGPLCFGADIIARNIRLANIEEGDFLMIHDTGGYTLSMWSRYTSRQIPKVLGYRDEGRHFVILKNRESLEELYQFWK
jgi:diaminopimelate decarboxylase